MIRVELRSPPDPDLGCPVMLDEVLYEAFAKQSHGDIKMLLI